jgi:hypothetical protein
MAVAVDILEALEEWAVGFIWEIMEERMEGM